MFLLWKGVDFCQIFFFLCLWKGSFPPVVYCIGWFSYIEPPLHFWDKSHLVIVYNTFKVLLNSVSWYFTEDFSVYIHKGYWSVFFSYGIFIWLWYQSNAGFIECVGKCSFLFYFFGRVWIGLVLNHYMFGRIHQWSLGFFFLVERFLITHSITLLVIGLFRFFLFSRVSFCNCCF